MRLPSNSAKQNKIYGTGYCFVRQCMVLKFLNELALKRLSYHFKSLVCLALFCAGYSSGEISEGALPRQLGLHTVV